MKWACSAVREEPPAIFRSQEAGKINLNLPEVLATPAENDRNCCKLNILHSNCHQKGPQCSCKTSIWKENSKKLQTIKPINIYKNKIDSEKFSEKFYICAAFHAEDACVMQTPEASRNHNRWVHFTTSALQGILDCSTVFVLSQIMGAECHCDLSYRWRAFMSKVRICYRPVLRRHAWQLIAHVTHSVFVWAVVHCYLIPENTGKAEFEALCRFK